MSNQLVLCDNDVIFGIDPGLKGGIACLNRFGVFVQGIRMPTRPVPVSKKVSRREVDINSIRQFYLDGVSSVSRGYDKPGRTYVITEYNTSRPKQGVASTYTFAWNSGLVAGAFAMMSDGYNWAVPNTWKGDMNLTGTGKLGSLELASSYWPEAPVRWRTKANDGIAEAALIAMWFLFRVSLGKVLSTRNVVDSEDKSNAVEQPNRGG